jgi:hypothetical protein
MNTIRLALGAAIALFVVGGASAQTSPCRGEAAAAGAEIHGPVLHVLDGQTLCVAKGTDPSQWTAVRLDDAPQAASWGALMSVAFGKDVTCVAEGAGGGAICRLDGRSIGAQLEGAAKAGVAWRPGAARPVDRNAIMRIAAF